MRIAAVIFLLASAFINLLLGGTSLISSKYQPFKVQGQTRDLSLVSSNLEVSEAELEKIHRVAVVRTGSAGVRQLILGIAALGVTLLQIVACILFYLRRAKRLAVRLTGLAAAALVALLMVEGFFALGAIALGAALLALILALFARSVPCSHAT